MSNLRSRLSLEPLDPRDVPSATPVASFAGGLNAPVAYTSLSPDPRFGATTQDVEGASDFLADDITFSGTKRVESFSIRYRAEVPVNSVVTFHSVDPVTGGPGAEVASFRLDNLPASTGAPQNAISRSVTLPEADRFNWESTTGLYKNSRSGIYGSDQTGGFLSVRFERLDGTVYESPTGGQIAAKPAGPTILDNQANGTNTLAGFWDLRTNTYNFGAIDYQPSSLSLQVDMKPVGTAPIVATQLTRFNLSAGTVAGGQSLTASITLSAPAPVGGLNLQLTSTNPAVPARTVLIPAGVMGFSFSVPTVSVSADTPVTISATLSGGGTLTSPVVVTAPIAGQAPALIGFTLSADTIRGGQNLSGTIQLSGPAPAGGLTLILNSSNPALAGRTVTVPAGQRTFTFTLSTVRVTTDTFAMISVTLDGLTLSDQVIITRRR